MVRSIEVVLALAALPQIAGAEDYSWWRTDHACIVDSAVALIPGPSSPQEAFRNWLDAPKSFRLQFTYCGAVPLAQSGWGTCESAEHLIIRTPNLRAVPHDGWRSSETRIFDSMDSFDKIGLYTNGRFYYSSLGTSGTSQMTWFTMTGTCTPFD